MSKNRHRRLRTITSAFALLALLGTAAEADNMDRDAITAAAMAAVMAKKCNIQEETDREKKPILWAAAALLERVGQQKTLEMAGRISELDNNDPKVIGACQVSLPVVQEMRGEIGKR